MSFFFYIITLIIPDIYMINKSNNRNYNLYNNLISLYETPFTRNLNTEGFGPAGDGYHI